MKTYTVKITYTVTEEYLVEANSPNEAELKAEYLEGKRLSSDAGQVIVSKITPRED
jgi:hypothetical protein